MALPFLVAVAPIFHLWSANVATVDIDQVLPVLGLLIAITALVFVGFTAITRDLLRSSVSVALVWLPLLTFGYQVDAVAPPPDSPWYEPALVAINGLLTIGIVAAAWRWNPDRAARFGAVAAAVFIASTLPGLAPGVSLAAPPHAEPIGQGDGPDIYFIILDAYGRADVLEEVYDYDNQPFLDGLRQRGFHVADRSYSNYAMTHLSLATTMTMGYLPMTAPYDVAAVGRLIEDAPAVRVLRDHGYRYVHFETEWFLTAKAPLADIVYRRGGFSSEFERAFFQTTLPGRVIPPPTRHGAVLDTLADLREVPAIDGPTFAFVHLLVPHPPFMFDENGTVIPYVDDIAASYDKEAYAAQLSYLNTEITGVVDHIIANSDRAPIIIMQGDHGPALSINAPTDQRIIHWERLGILNAMLVPEDVKSELYPSISPVNTFRVLLRELFDADLPTLPDRSFYNWYNAMPGSDAAVEGDELQLSEVTDALP